jgi:hypothetical protein
MEDVFYSNLYIEDYKLVVKTPIVIKKTVKKWDTIVEEFDLTKYTYLTAFK